MRDPKALALFREILKKTEAGKIPWQATAEADTFIAPMLGKLTINFLPYTSLATGWQGQPVGPPSLTVTDTRQNIVVEMNHAIDGIDDDDLQELLIFARRVALKTDEQIDELMKELQKPDKEPDEDLPF
jgi:hypothetical protein